MSVNNSEKDDRKQASMDTDRAFDNARTGSGSSSSSSSDDKNSSSDSKDFDKSALGLQDDKDSKDNKNKDDKSSDKSLDKKTSDAANSKDLSFKSDKDGSNDSKSGLSLDVDGDVGGHKSKGGHDSKGLEDLSFSKNKSGKAGNKSNQSLLQRLKSLAMKASLMAHAALQFVKTLIFIQLLSFLNSFVSSIISAVAGLLSTIFAFITSVATTVATLLGVSVAIATISVIGVVGTVFVCIIVLVVTVITNNTASKDDVTIPCEPIDTEYMEVPEDVQADAWTNAKIIYTFFKSYSEAVVKATGNPDAAITDEMIAGILGNWYGESGIDATAIETIYDEPYGFGVRKQFVWQGSISCTRNYDSDGNYISTTIDPSYPSESTVAYFYNEDTGSDTITIYDPDNIYSDGTHGPIMFNIHWLQDIYKQDYWAKYPAIKRMGIGLGQWTDTTGPGYPLDPEGRGKNLLTYAEEHKVPWYNVGLQLMYCIDGDTRKSFFETWSVPRSVTSHTLATGETYSNGYVYNGVTMETAGQIAMATETFLNKWEGVSTTAISDHGNNGKKRVEYAMMWYNIITEWQEGVDYTIETGTSMWESLESAGIIASDKSQSSSARQCNEVTFMANNDLAEAMVSFAWSPMQDDHNNGTQCWQHLFTSIFPGDPYYRSCDRTVAVGVRWSGTDSDFPIGSTSEQLNYLLDKDASYRAMLSNPNASMSNDTAWWMKVDTTWNGNVEDYFNQLEPGDILIRCDDVEVPSGYSYQGVRHIICYVGEEAVLNRWPDSEPGQYIVHGSINSRSPGTDKVYSSGTGSSALQSYYVFRNMKTYVSEEGKADVALTCAGYSNNS